MKPLEGITVVTLEQAVAAPMASCRLADAGARVIKIERPSGDFARGYDDVIYGEASYFLWLNRGKESIVLDLKTEDDKQLLENTLSKADVFIQNLATGATSRLGIGSDKLRARYPKLITCDISGYGEGDYSHMKAYDFLVQCESGLVAISGGENELGRIGVSVCDIATGMNAYAGVLEALLLRERTNKGSSIKTSLFATAAEWMQVPLAHYDYAGKAPKRVGLSHPSISPYGGYKTKDNETVVISVQNNREWKSFVEKILQELWMIEDERFATNVARVQNRTEMNGIIDKVFANYAKDELLPLLSKAGIAYGSVNSVANLSKHPALKRKSMLVGTFSASMIAPAVTTEFADEHFAPAPALGEHSDKIREEFKD